MTIQITMQDKLRAASRCAEYLPVEFSGDILALETPHLIRALRSHVAFILAKSCSLTLISTTFSDVGELIHYLETLDMRRPEDCIDALLGVTTLLSLRAVVIRDVDYNIEELECPTC